MQRSSGPIGRTAIKILFVTDSIREPLTGVGRVALTHLRGLLKLDCEVIPLDQEENPVVHKLCGEHPVLPVQLPKIRTALWHLNLLRRLPGLGIRHDVLFDPTGYPNALGQHQRQAVLVHDLSMFQGKIYRPGKRSYFGLFYGRALSRAQLLVCVSEHTRRELLARFHLDPKRCVVVPNSLDPVFAKALGKGKAEAPEAPEAKDERRQENQENPDPRPPGPYFLAVGTIERRKNTHRLLDAFAQARKAGVVAQLVLAGRPGHGGPQLLARARAPDLEGVVHVHSGLDDAQLARLYRRSLALLFPSLDEGFGMPILEAMQAGIPVLTADRSAMPEVAGDAAILVDPTSTEAIKVGIERLAHEPMLRAELARKGRLRLPLFEAGRHAKALLARLQGLCGEGLCGEEGGTMETETETTEAEQRV